MCCTYTPGFMMLDGFWTARRVKIDFNSLTNIRKGRYKMNIFRRAVYNLHSKGIIRFYTSGQDFIELRDKSGFTYRIGTQRPTEILKIIESQIK
jgi:hypothetical protein